jgi:hypothetical protein
VGGLDIKAPPIGFLSEDSSDFVKANPSAIKYLNNQVNTLPNIKYSEISYYSMSFGCLGGLPRVCGYDLFSKVFLHPSSAGINSVLHGRTRSSLVGDGVPFGNQKMSKLAGFPWPVVSSGNIQILHTGETKDLLSPAGIA